MTHLIAVRPEVIGTALSREPGVGGTLNAYTRRPPCQAATIYGWQRIEEHFERLREAGRPDTAVFFRHGSTKYNERGLVSGQHDTVLSEEGREQARRMRSTMLPKIDLIVCSALTRSFETMELGVPPDQRANVKVLVDARLNEVNLGVLQGRRRRHLPAYEAGDIDYAPDQGESYRQAARRVLSVVVDVFELLAGSGTSPRYAAVFCHAGVLRILGTLAGRGSDPREVFKTTHRNAERLELAADSISLPRYWRAEFDAA